MPSIKGVPNIPTVSKKSFEKLIHDELGTESTSAVRLVEHVLKHAHESKASDVHLCPSPTALIVRFRIDGVLKDFYSLPIWIHEEMLARLKILAGMRIDEHKIPQDGRFRLSLKTSSSEDEHVDIRVSVAPTYQGENAVLRLLSLHGDISDLASLGLSKHDQELIINALMNPHGLILITGPTGSGKTSTFYRLIQRLNVRAVSIVTIEDPIEYSIDGITQIQTDPKAGYTFAEGLKSILRQDPNIIGLGEIRDYETASLAVHAALTGHLVISTLHTTSAPAALPRLFNLGIEPYLVASTLKLVIAERLVQRLCTFCRVPIDLSNEQLEKLTKISSRTHFQENYYVARGCTHCGGTGARGRIGLFEILHISNEFQMAIEDKYPLAALTKFATQQGMKSLLYDGLSKAAAGLISLEDAFALYYE